MVNSINRGVKSRYFLIICLSNGRKAGYSKKFRVICMYAYTAAGLILNLRQTLKTHSWFDQLP